MAVCLHLLHLLLLSCCLQPAVASPTAPWKPVPPCSAPPGIHAPAVSESMCSEVLAEQGGVTVRAMGLPAAETLIAGSFWASQWDVVIGYGVSSLIDYFEGDNTPQRKLLSARTTPVTFRQRSFPNGTVYEWRSAMMLSTSAFPATAGIPQPVDPIQLEPVGSRLVAVVQFNSSGFPSEQDFAAACGSISPSTLPRGYAVNASSSWSPTYALYSRESSRVFENECWMEVSKLA